MGYGIRVWNPLPKPVRVEVIEGKTILREAIVEPHTTIIFNLKKAGSYDVRTTILDSRLGTAYEELGLASFEVTNHQDVVEIKTKRKTDQVEVKEEEEPIRSMGEMFDDMRKKEVPV